MDTASLSSELSKLRMKHHDMGDSHHDDEYSTSTGVATTKSMKTIKRIEEYVNFELNKAKGRVTVPMETQHEDERSLKSVDSHTTRSTHGTRVTLDTRHTHGTKNTLGTKHTHATKNTLGTKHTHFTRNTLGTKHTHGTKNTLGTKHTLNAHITNSRGTKPTIYEPSERGSIWSTPTVDADDMSVEISISSKSHPTHYSKNESMSYSSGNRSRADDSSKRSGGKVNNRLPPSYHDSENAPPNGQKIDVERSVKSSKSTRAPSMERTSRSHVRSKSNAGSITTDVESRGSNNSRRSSSSHRSSDEVSLTSSKKYEISLNEAIKKLQKNDGPNEFELANEKASWETKVNQLAEMIHEERNKNSRLEELEKLLGEKKSRIREDANKAKWQIKIDELERLLEEKRAEKNEKLLKLSALLEDLKREKTNKTKIYAALEKRSQKSVKSAKDNESCSNSIKKSRSLLSKFSKKKSSDDNSTNNESRKTRSTSRRH